MSLKDLREANLKRSAEWMGVDALPYEDILFRAVELGGEAGEALNIVKKYSRFLKRAKGGVNYRETSEELAKELADIIICCDRLAYSFQIDLKDAVKEKFNETSQKHGFKTLMK